jgi:hypothetical protein
MGSAFGAASSVFDGAIMHAAANASSPTGIRLKIRMHRFLQM